MVAVLIQNDESGRAHPIYYGSRLLIACELKYPSTKTCGITSFCLFKE
jgi:hypothetical protein